MISRLKLFKAVTKRDALLRPCRNVQAVSIVEAGTLNCWKLSKFYRFYRVLILSIISRKLSLKTSVIVSVKIREGSAIYLSIFKLKYFPNYVFNPSE